MMTKLNDDRGLVLNALKATTAFAALNLPGCIETPSLDAQGNSLSVPVRAAPQLKLGAIEGRPIYLVDIHGQPCVFVSYEGDPSWVPHRGYGHEFKVSEKITLPENTVRFTFSVGSADYHLTESTHGITLEVAAPKRVP